ncbi:MAG: signal peptidase II [Actinomycetota bacterium]
MRALRQAHREGQAQGAPVREPLYQGQAGRGQTLRRRLAPWVYGSGVLVYGIDRLTKVLAEDNLTDHSVKLIPGVLHLTYTTNPGGAFGLFGNAPYLFLAATLVVCVAIVVASVGVGHRLLAVGLGMVLGGALGNLTDRIVRGSGFDGQVIDFIDFRIWPVFNLADAAIVIGAGLIVLSGFHRAPDPAS